MYIISIKRNSRYRFLVVTEEEKLILSEKEVRKFDLKEGMELSKEQVERLLEEELIPRAKRKAIDLLLKMDYAEKELERKLLGKGFGKAATEVALLYVKGYRYIDDERFTQNYVRFRGKGKSRLQLQLELTRKGIDMDKAKKLLADGVDEEEAVEQLIKKKVGNKEILGKEERRKLMAYLFRRGFDGEVIRAKMRELLPSYEEE